MSTTVDRIFGKYKRSALVGLILLSSMIAAYNMDSLYMETIGDTNIILASGNQFYAEGENGFLLALQDGGGDPLQEDVAVYLEMNGDRELVYEGQTDEDGLCVASFTGTGESGVGSLVVESGGNNLKQSVFMNPGEGSGTGSRRLIITTDKPVYKPGQIIHIRTLALEAGGGIFNGTMIIDVLTPEGDKIVHEELDINDHGVSSYDLSLGNSLPLGEYTIELSIGGDKWDRTVIVDKYVLPRFEMKLEGLQSWYAQDDAFDLVLDIDYFFGKPVDGSVTVRTEIFQAGYYAQPFQPEPWMGGGGMEADMRFAEPWMDDTVSVSAPSSTGSWTTVDYRILTILDGHVDLEIPSMDGLSQYVWGTHALRFNITATDTAFHTENKLYSSVVSATPIVLSVLGDTNVNGHPSTYHVLAQTPDGKALPGADISVSSHDIDISTDQWGLAEISYVYEGENYVGMNVTKGSDSADFLIPVYEWRNEIKVSSDKVYYSMGETAYLDVYSSQMRGSVYWEARVGSKIVRADRAEIIGGRSSFDIYISPDMSSSLDIWVYRTSGDIVKDSLSLVVEPTGGLEVNITSDKDVYLPGEDVLISLLASNLSGGSPGVAGLSIVDRSVLELGDRYLGLEGVFFDNPYYETGLSTAMASYIENPERGALPLTVGTSNYEESEGMVDIGVLDTSSESLETAKDVKDTAVSAIWIIMGAVVLFGIVGYVATREIKPNKVLAAMFVFVVIVIASVFMLSGFMVQQYTESANDFAEPMGIPGGGMQEEANDAAIDDWFDFGFGREMLEADTNKMAAFAPSVAHSNGPSTVHVRNFFPETWFWEPMVILDENGTAELDLVVPDSLTSWEIEAVASNLEGEVGLGKHNITVFQEFFVEPDLPYSLLRNDTVTMSVTMYNYRQDRSVSISVEEDEWFELLSPAIVDTAAVADTVTAVNFTIRPLSVGSHTLRVIALANGEGDAIEKSVIVRSDGLREVTTHNGALVDDNSTSVSISPSLDRITGSEQLYVKLQAGIAAITVDGAEQFIQYVSGCGEQSLSTLSIDILAYKHIKDGNPNSEKLAQFKDIVEKGIQHELQYVMEGNNGEGRGIVWFPGDQDVHPWLTAWGLIAFQDAIDAGFYVDPQVLEDMGDWLMSQQRSDGSWEFPSWGLYETTNPALLKKEAGATAYIARSLLLAGIPSTDSSIVDAMGYLEGEAASYVDDAYTSAMMLLAMELGDAGASARNLLANALIDMAVLENGSARWEGDSSLTSYDRYWGPNNAHTIEATAYATMALYEHGGSASLVAGGIQYLLDNRDGLGGFFSTQDTVVAFQAIGSVGEIDLEHMAIDVSVNGNTISTSTFDENKRDITYYVDVELDNMTWPVQIDVDSTGVGQVMYQIVYIEYLPWSQPAPTGLELELEYSDTSIQVGESIEVVGTLSYNGSTEMLQMVLVHLVAPTGFYLLEKDFDIMDEEGDIAYYDQSMEGYNLYIQPVKSGSVHTFTYHMESLLPVSTIAEGSHAYDMYNPDLSSTVEPVPIQVS